MRVGYFVHDLNDAAVLRRVALLEHGGASVRIGGFRRNDHAPTHVGGAPAVDFGRTGDSALMQRVLAVARHCACTRAAAAVADQADVLIARNLEMLVIARRVRRPGQRLVYECLDIHRLLLGRGWVTRVLHAIEDWAMRKVDLLLTSAPRFLTDYFEPRRGEGSTALLVENKVPAFDTEARPDSVQPPPGPPWVIGWFGMLRCRKSLAMLGDIARASHGRVQVVLAGRPSAVEFPDFATEVSMYPGLRYLGPYQPAQLPELFACIHFVWAIDYFEQGLNSAWLLPNRLYEGIAHGAVPLALRHVATGDWLTEHGCGVLLDDPEVELEPMLSALDDACYARLRAAVSAVPDAAVLMLEPEARSIVEAIGQDGDRAGDKAAP
jgi:hypothetical protein